MEVIEYVEALTSINNDPVSTEECTGPISIPDSTVDVASPEGRLGVISSPPAYRDGRSSADNVDTKTLTSISCTSEAVMPGI